MWLLKILKHMFPKELGHSLRKVYCSLRKLVFPKITIMSLGRKNFFPFTIWLFMGQLKPYFLWEHGCSLGNNLNPFLTWKCVFIHFIHEWKIIQDKVWIQDFWAIRGIVISTLIFFLWKEYIKKYLNCPHCTSIVKQNLMFFLVGHCTIL